jgi:hypothetical protein
VHFLLTYKCLDDNDEEDEGEDSFCLDRNDGFEGGGVGVVEEFPVVEGDDQVHE